MCMQKHNLGYINGYISVQTLTEKLQLSPGSRENRGIALLVGSLFATDCACVQSFSSEPE